VSLDCHYDGVIENIKWFTFDFLLSEQTEEVRLQTACYLIGFGKIFNGLNRSDRETDYSSPVNEWCRGVQYIYHLHTP
jgi:hypothetical protein